MNNKNAYPQIKLRKLILVGTRKDYIVKFRAGLNIIYGDSDTGKSSILNLIDYSLGARAVYLYPEIQSTGKYSLLEVAINGKIYTIKRDIFDSNKEIDVFPSTVENIADVFPKSYYPTYSKKGGELEFFSDFLLANLGIADVKVKKAPSKEDSEMVRLSFRDVFKYCYLNQDAVGSKHILDSNDWALKTKNQEVFKYIFNLLDSNISQLQAELSEARTQRDELIKTHKTVSAFLRNTQLENYEALITARNQTDDSIYSIQQEISRLNSGMISNSEEHDQLRNDVGEHDIKLQELIARNEIHELQIRNSIILKKDYLADIQKIEASLEVIAKVSGPTDHIFDCPLCSTPIKVDGIKHNFDSHDKVSLEKELQNLKKRLKEIDKLIQSIREENEEIQVDISIHKSALKSLRLQIDTESKEMVSPFVTQLEKLVSDKATLQESRRSLDYRIKVRSSLVEIDSQNIVIDNKMSLLREQLASLKDSAPTVDGVLATLADYVSDFLTAVKLKQAYGISINSKLFLPIVRNTQYEDLTSGGVRTLVSISYIISMLMYSLSTNINHPKLVMIDTVGKYLGKTSPKFQDTDKESDAAEGITQTDATKYTEMYKQFIQMDSIYSNFQLIIVDNDLPISLEKELQQYVIKHFDEAGANGLAKGFIDDIA
jgi:predicted  nucleic acid-binding Zn-ribbon protein